MPKVSVEHEQMRRQQILDAALACFSRDGYHATSMEDLVHECGLSIGAIYTYFASKEDLFRALAEAHVERMMQRLQEVFGASQPLAQRLERGLDFFFAALDDEIGPWSRIVFEFWSQSATLPTVAGLERRRCEALRSDFTVLLRHAIIAGECRPDLDAEATADLLLALGDGLVLRWLRGDARTERERLKLAFKDLIRRGVLSGPRDPGGLCGTPAPESSLGAIGEARA